MVEIKKIKADEAFPIRKEVLRKNIPLPYKFEGDLNDATFHLGAFCNNKLIAVSTFMQVENKNFTGKQYQLRGMATLANYQGIGVGKLMMLKAFEILAKLNSDILWCNARIVAVPFYEKLGLIKFGKEFTIDFVGKHFVMYKKLKA